jgi:branched-chain amino acid aminotransferase
MKGKYFFSDGNFKNLTDTDFTKIPAGSAIYEVIRIIDGIPLFVEDHLERLENSAKIVFKHALINTSDLIKNIVLLSRKNQIDKGNIRLIIRPNQSKAKLGLQTTIFFLPHSYPAPSDYNRGFQLKSLIMERQNPNAKVMNQLLAEKVQKMKEEYQNLDEVLLIREDGVVTEGSKSNIFFVKDNKVITPDKNIVLAGITRQKIMDILVENKIDCIEKPNLTIAEITKMDGAFISGTSPKVMPVSKIDEIVYDVNNDMIKRIAALYENLIGKYIATFRESELAYSA